MKVLQDKNRILWVLMLIAVVVAIVIYRMGLLFSVPGFNEEAVKSLEISRQQEAETKQNQAEPAASVNSPEPSHAADLRGGLSKEPQYGSEHPLYFRVVFGEEGNNSMLGIVDESGGTGTGYDVAYVDENMNGDLTDDAAREFPRRERGSRAGELEPRFEFKGPFEIEGSAKYSLNIYSLAPRYRGSVKGNDYYFFWYLNTREWNYFFINGKMTLFSNVADALKGKPVRLGGQCQWEISSGTRDGKAMVSAGLKDRNGCTLRIVRRANERVSPTLTLIQDGKVRTEEKMKFG